MMKTQIFTIASLTALFAAPAAAEPHLVLRLIVDEPYIGSGGSANWQLWAELMEPDDEILATVSAISFSLHFNGHPSLSITNNTFSPAFDSIFGPTNNGTVTGDALTGASGLNALPPLNIFGGPDSSNPLLIYSFTMVHNGNGGGEMYTPQLTIEGVMNGAYTNPFALFYYQGGTTNVPFTIDADTVYNVPAPGAGATAILALSIASRRRRVSRE